MRKLTLKGLSAILLFAVLACGCHAKSDDAIMVDISIIDQYDTVPSEQLEMTLAAWETEHPDIEVEERSRMTNEDYRLLPVLGTEHLPDIFITDSKYGMLLANAGLVLDVTDYAEDVGTLTYNGNVYAFPGLRESISVIVYDSSSWSEGDSFGYISSDGYSLVSGFLSGELSDVAGQEWLTHMIEDDRQASFNDEFFIGVLDGMTESMNNNTPYSSLDGITASFINGACSAVLLSGDRLYKFLDDVKASDPDLYSRLEFTTYDEGYLPRGYSYGVFLNADLEGERLELCLDLANALSNNIEEDDDDILMRIDALRDVSTPVYYVSDYFTPFFWQFAEQDCFTRLGTGGLTSEEYSVILQNYYEEYSIVDWDS